MGPWFVYSPTGTVQRQTNPVLAAGLIAAGWKGFPTEAAADAYAHDQSTAHHVDDARHDIAAAPETVAGFLSKINDRGTWIRLAEGMVGLLLILVSVAKLAEGTAIGTAIKKVPFI